MHKDRSRRTRRILRTSLLIVGEGIIDKAFINHMKTLYDGRTDQTVKVEAADGGCPYDVVNKAVKCRHAAYDRKFVLVDDDIVIPNDAKALAQDNGISILVSNPVCLEGMLLSILKQNPLLTNTECKSKLHPMLDGSPALPLSYAKLFTKTLLDSSTHDVIIRIKTLLINK